MNYTHFMIKTRILAGQPQVQAYSVGGKARLDPNYK